jgi:hypothetical protein
MSFIYKCERRSQHSKLSRHIFLGAAEKHKKMFALKFVVSRKDEESENVLSTNLFQQKLPLVTSSV